PSLAKSLQNVASILWTLKRRDESITACESAMKIMRRVAEKETYFLAALVEALEQLAGYLVENGDTEHASAVTSEASEVRAKIALLPPE
ncbi:hypothetical protein DFH07DRAFT_721815, partial [Mycena maculata]